uniref:PDZ domain-containing protein n=1 Tax=Cynoglossus semilaevis TaxID=244447 RepID=A0A3P8VH42_CYNSE
MPGEVSFLQTLEFKKTEGGGLGFALIAGTNGSLLRVKEICCGGAAEQDGRLRVGDILLEVNGVIVSGLSHSKVVDILRKAEGTYEFMARRGEGHRGKVERGGVNCLGCLMGFFICE